MSKLTAQQEAALHVSLNAFLHTVQHMGARVHGIVVVPRETGDLCVRIAGQDGSERDWHSSVSLCARFIDLLTDLPEPPTTVEALTAHLDTVGERLHAVAQHLRTTEAERVAGETRRQEQAELVAWVEAWREE